MNVLEKNIASAVSKEAAGGSARPTGALNAALAGIFINEIDIFSKMLHNAINKAVANIDKHNVLKPLELTIKELLVCHKENISKMYRDYVHLYFSDEPFPDFYLISERSFSNTAAVETEQRIKYIISSTTLEKFA